MKYIKKYKIFESTEQDFVYKFEFPVKKIYNIDENNIDIDNIAFYLSNRGVDIYKDISNELDLGFSTDEEDEESINISKEDVKANFDEYFNSWIEQNYDGDWSKFYRMYDLDFEENDISKDDFQNIKNGFNTDDLKKYYPYREYNHDFIIKEMSIESHKNNIIVGRLIVNRELTEDELGAVEDYITEQCSDGWGEGFSQESEKEIIDGVHFHTSISTWWGESYPVWYMNISID